MAAPYEESGSITPQMIQGVYDLMLEIPLQLQSSVLLVPPNLQAVAQELLSGAGAQPIIRSEVEERFAERRSAHGRMRSMGDSAQRTVERAAVQAFQTGTAWYLAPEHDTNMVWDYRGGTTA